MEYANLLLEMLERIKILEQDMKEVKKILKIDSLMETDNSDEFGAKKTESEGLTAVEPTRGLPVTTYTNKKDTTRYMFNGNVYLKNRLVLAVVKEYVKLNAPLTINELKNVFPRTLQGSIGVVEDSKYASTRYDYGKRFFTREGEVLHLSDGEAFVCTQWGIGNIENFIRKAEQIGFKITPLQ